VNDSVGVDVNNGVVINESEDVLLLMIIVWCPVRSQCNSGDSVDFRLPWCPTSTFSMLNVSV